MSSINELADAIGAEIRTLEHERGIHAAYPVTAHLLVAYAETRKAARQLEAMTQEARA